MARVIGASFSRHASICLTTNDILIRFAGRVFRRSASFSLRKELRRWKILREEEKRTLSSSAGWAILGGAIGSLLNPISGIIGATAAVAAAGKKNYTIVACRFAGGHRCILELNDEEMAKFLSIVPKEVQAQEAAYSGAFSKTADALCKLYMLYSNGILSADEYCVKRQALLENL